MATAPERFASYVVTPEGGATIDVTITGPAYTDELGTTPATFPDTISAATTYWISRSDETSELVVEIDGTEIIRERTRGRAGRYVGPADLDLAEQQTAFAGAGGISQEAADDRYGAVANFYAYQAAADTIVIPSGFAGSDLGTVVDTVDDSSYSPVGDGSPLFSYNTATGLFTITAPMVEIDATVGFTADDPTTPALLTAVISPTDTARLTCGDAKTFDPDGIQSYVTLTPKRTFFAAGDTFRLKMSRGATAVTLNYVEFCVRAQAIVFEEAS